MRFGLIGLGASGKTTVFNVLSGRSEPVGTYGAQPGAVSAMVSIPDARVADVAAAYRPVKTTYAAIELFDITGLFDEKGAAKADLTAQVREMDGIGVVLRAFDDPGVPHPNGRIDPIADLEAIHAEMVLADQAICEKRLERIAATVKKPVPNREELERERVVVTRCLEALREGRRVADLGLREDEARLIRGFRQLTEMPQVAILNTGEKSESKQGVVNRGRVESIPGKIELEIAQLEEAERAEFRAALGVVEGARDRLLQAIHEQLGLIRFITFGEDECRTWSIRRGAKAIDAAAAIHTDLARGFIRAEVFSYDDWASCGRSEKNLRAAGKLRLEGKTYEVRDGDMIVIRFSV